MAETSAINIMSAYNGQIYAYKTIDEVQNVDLI